MQGETVQTDYYFQGNHCLKSHMIPTHLLRGHADGTHRKHELQNVVCAQLWQSKYY